MLPKYAIYEKLLHAQVVAVIRGQNSQEALEVSKRPFQEVSAPLSLHTQLLKWKMSLRNSGIKIFFLEPVL